ncbi:MAG: AbrB/MazE/SpoVT family DNA-binding domain-containing protein [Propionibacteriaceae bacterium]|jgi:AbrB family looped-hinge helix DNA binding protein|nr:AbrB/MazE/SpoVT family DNA-binding domain-containing protein [Propionibacteriaceae bacterium]
MKNGKSPSFPWQYVPRPGKVYGAATVGERGQIALPADARRDMGINPGDKLMVFANKLNGSLVLMKADVVENFADFFMTKLNKLGVEAQEFFDSFTEVRPDSADDDAEAADVSDDDAASHDAATAPTEDATSDNIAADPSGDTADLPASAKRRRSTKAANQDAVTAPTSDAPAKPAKPARSRRSAKAAKGSTE